MEKHPKATFLPAALPTYHQQQQAAARGGPKPAAPSAASSTLSIDGVFGFFDLPSGGHYLAVITDSEERYRGHGMEFRLVTKVTLVRVSNSTATEGATGAGSGKRGGTKITTAAMLGDEEEEEEEDEDTRQLELLRMAFRAHDLYFSTTCDVTLSAQRRATLGACVVGAWMGWVGMDGWVRIVLNVRGPHVHKLTSTQTRRTPQRGRPPTPPASRPGARG